MLEFSARKVGPVNEKAPRRRRALLVLSPRGRKGWAEGVDGAERAREVLPVELPRDSEVRGLAEEVLGVVDAAARRLRQRLGKVEGGHLEHLARALAVRARDERRVHVHEARLLEEAVRRVGQRVAHAHHGAHHARARPHVREAAQRLEVDLCGRDRVAAPIRGADDLDAAHGQLPPLPLLRRQLERAGHAHRRAVAGALGGLPRGGVELVFLEDELEVGLARAVVDRHEAELLLRPTGRREEASRGMARERPRRFCCGRLVLTQPHTTTSLPSASGLA